MDRPGRLLRVEAQSQRSRADCTRPISAACYAECDAVLTIGAKLAYLGNNTIAIAGMTGTGDFETTSGAVTRTAEEVDGGDNPFVAKMTLAADATAI